jgi:hypothetical protein
MEEKALPYEILRVGDEGLPEVRCLAVIRAVLGRWRKLPLAVTRWVGPRLTRMFP